MRSTVVAMVVVAAMAWGTVASAQSAAPTEASLKATHQLLIQAVSSGNPALISSIMAPNGIGFFRESQQLVELGGGVTVMGIAPTLLGDVSRFTATQYSTTVRVIGNVGVVALTSVLAPTPEAKKQKVEDRYNRSSFMYVFTSDGWKLVSWHISQTPLKVKK